VDVVCRSPDPSCLEEDIAAVAVSLLSARLAGEERSCSIAHDIPPVVAAISGVLGKR
jgi:hypothetical protein